VVAALACTDVSLVIDGARILDGVSWEIHPGEHWVVLGPNGAGKTTLLRIAALYLHPTAGTVDVLGQRLGRTDVRTLRERLAFSSPALAARLEPSMTATEVVMTARYAALARGGTSTPTPTGRGRCRCSSVSGARRSPSTSSRRCRRVSVSACCSPAH
jgi:iron complex transport system ATP-binding protein